MNTVLCNRGSGRAEDTDGLGAILAYITGRVDQELLFRNECLATENRILQAQISGACGCRMWSALRWAKLAIDWAARRWRGGGGTPMVHDPIRFWDQIGLAC